MRTAINLYDLIHGLWVLAMVYNTVLSLAMAGSGINIKYRRYDRWCSYLVDAGIEHVRVVVCLTTEIHHLGTGHGCKLLNKYLLCACKVGVLFPDTRWCLVSWSGLYINNICYDAIQYRISSNTPEHVHVGSMQ